MVVKVGSMHGGMASGAKTRALRQTPAMNLFADNGKIHLGVAAQAQIAVTRDQHFGVHGPVDLMASRAAFTDRLMLKNKRTSLFLVAIEAGLVDPF